MFSFFDGDDDKDDMLCDGRPATVKTNETTPQEEGDMGGGVGEVGDVGKGNGGVDEYEIDFDVMQELPSQDILFQPSPPSSRPPTNRGSNGKRIRVRGPKGLRYVRSLNVNRVAGPPAALTSYQGVQTMWSEGNGNEKSSFAAGSNKLLNFE